MHIYICIYIYIGLTARVGKMGCLRWNGVVPKPLKRHRT